MKLKQSKEFPRDHLAPVPFVHALAQVTIDGLKWEDTSWHNDAAPSFSLNDDERKYVQAFYFTTANHELRDDHVREYVEVVFYDDNDDMTDSYTTTPARFLELVQRDGMTVKFLDAELDRDRSQPTPPPPKENIATFAERLSDAFSTDRYRNGWSGCIRMLRKRGYNDKEIEAIIRSKWTRWSGDASEKRYGTYTSTDLAKFMDSMRPEVRARNIALLVIETFPNG